MMENKAVEVINALCDKLGLAIDWTQQNVMPQVLDALSRVRTYYIIRSSIGTFIGLAMMILLVLLGAQVIIGRKRAVSSYKNWPIIKSEPYEVTWRDWNQEKNTYVNVKETRVKNVEDPNYKPFESIFWDNYYKDMGLSSLGLCVVIFGSVLLFGFLAMLCINAENLLKWIITPELQYIDLIASIK